MKQGVRLVEWFNSHILNQAPSLLKFWNDTIVLSNFKASIYDLIWRTCICNLLNYFSWYEILTKIMIVLKTMNKCIFLSSLQSDIEWNNIDMNFIHIYWIKVVQIYLDKHIIYSGKLFSTGTFGFLCHVYIVFRYIDPWCWVSDLYYQTMPLMWKCFDVYPMVLICESSNNDKCQFRFGWPFFVHRILCTSYVNILYGKSLASDLYFFVHLYAISQCLKAWDWWKSQGSWFL